jgi:hypothetical protein
MRHCNGFQEAWDSLGTGPHSFIGLAYQGKDIVVFRFIIEYSSLRDFYRPLGNNNNNNRSILFYFYVRIFER